MWILLALLLVVAVFGRQRHDHHARWKRHLQNTWDAMGSVPQKSPPPLSMQPADAAAEPAGISYQNMNGAANANMNMNDPNMNMNMNNDPNNDPLLDMTMQFGDNNGGDFGGEFGDFDDFDEEEDDEMDMVLGVLEQYSDDFAACGLDLGSLMTDEQDLDDEEEASMDPFALLQMMKLSPPCSATQKETMRNALHQFETCSGYDVLGLDESLLGSLSGAMTKCANSVTAIDMAMLNLPKDCARALLGHHPLGQAVRDLLLHPGATGTCFKELGQQAPQCSLDLWPFPVDGKSIRMGSCLSKKVEDIWTTECHAGLAELGTCLPDPSAITASQCDTYLEQCGATSNSWFVMMIANLPKTLQGMPLPDTCQDHGDASTVAKYEAFRATCAPTGKEFWEELDDTSGQQEPALETFAQFLHPNDSGSDPQTTVISAPTTNLDESFNEMEQKEEKEQVEEEVESKSSSSGTSTFGFGVLTGLLLVVVGYVGFVVVRKQRAGEITGWGGYRLTDNSTLEMKPTYSDESGGGSLA